MIIPDIWKNKKCSKPPTVQFWVHDYGKPPMTGAESGRVTWLIVRVGREGLRLESSGRKEWFSWATWEIQKWKVERDKPSETLV